MEWLKIIARCFRELWAFLPPSTIFAGVRCTSGHHICLVLLILMLRLR